MRALAVMERRRERKEGVGTKGFGTSRRTLQTCSMCTAHRHCKDLLPPCHCSAATRRVTPRECARGTCQGKRRLTNPRWLLLAWLCCGAMPLSHATPHSPSVDRPSRKKKKHTGSHHPSQFARYLLSPFHSKSPTPSLQSGPPPTRARHPTANRSRRPHSTSFGIYLPTRNGDSPSGRWPPRH